jgi:hypothetical protein
MRGQHSDLRLLESLRIATRIRPCGQPGPPFPARGAASLQIREQFQMAPRGIRLLQAFTRTTGAVRKNRSQTFGLALAELDRPFAVIGLWRTHTADESSESRLWDNRG